MKIHQTTILIHIPVVQKSVESLVSSHQFVLFVFCPTLPGATSRGRPIKEMKVGACVFIVSIEIASFCGY